MKTKPYFEKLIHLLYKEGTKRPLREVKKALKLSGEGCLLMRANVFV